MGNDGDEQEWQPKSTKPRLNKGNCYCFLFRIDNNHSSESIRDFFKIILNRP
jgi:ferredoxin-thioredoxin reductase catalytic subunit